MEFYLSFDELLGRTASPIIVILAPVFFITTVLEGLLIMRQQGTYPWKNASVSLGMAVGHFITQAATRGLIFGVIAATVYEIRLTTIPTGMEHWTSLIVLFVLVDLAFYVEHRSSHQIRFLWASHSVHHSSEKMLVTTAYRLTWTPILSGVFAFYLPIVWIGYSPAWVYGMASGSLAYQFFVHTELVPRVGWLEWLINTPSATEYITRATPNTSTRTMAACCCSGTIYSVHTKLSGPTFRSAMDWRIQVRPPTTPLSSLMRMSG